MECSLLKELGVKLNYTPLLLSDSTSAAAIATNPVLHSKIKNVEIDIHFVKDKVEKKEIKIAFVSSNDQTTNVLTKPLTYSKFSFFINKLKVSPRDLSLRRDVKFENKAEPGSTHVGIPAGVYLLTKENTHTSEVMQSTRAEEEYSIWHNNYTEIPQLLCDVGNYL